MLNNASIARKHLSKLHGKPHVASHFELALHKQALPVGSTSEHSQKIFLLEAKGAVSLGRGALHYASRRILEIDCPLLDLTTGFDVQLVDAIDLVYQAWIPCDVLLDLAES